MEYNIWEDIEQLITTVSSQILGLNTRKWKNLDKCYSASIDCKLISVEPNNILRGDLQSKKNGKLFHLVDTTVDRFKN